MVIDEDHDSHDADTVDDDDDGGSGGDDDDDDDDRNELNFIGSLYMGECLFNYLFDLQPQIYVICRLTNLQDPYKLY